MVRIDELQNELIHLCIGTMIDGICQLESSIISLECERNPNFLHSDPIGLSSQRNAP